jgi:antagonist of KipI
LGGYPRILQVAAVDLHLIGQLRTNDSITFKKVSISQAQNELKKQNYLFPF